MMRNSLLWKFCHDVETWLVSLLYGLAVGAILFGVGFLVKAVELGYLF